MSGEMMIFESLVQSVTDRVQQSRIPYPIRPKRDHAFSMLLGAAIADDFERGSAVLAAFLDGFLLRNPDEFESGLTKIREAMNTSFEGARQ